MAEFVFKAPVEARAVAKAEAFFSSPAGRQLKEISQTTIPLDLVNVVNFKPELAVRSVGLTINNVFEDLSFKGVKLTDVYGNLALALPNVNIQLPYGLEKDQKGQVQRQVSGLLRDWQEAQFLQSALKMKGSLNWRAMEKEIGLRNPGEVKGRLKQLQDLAPERVVDLTNALLGKKKLTEAKAWKPLIKASKRAVILPAAQYAQVEVGARVSRQRSKIREVLPLLALAGLSVTVNGCTVAPIEVSPTIAVGASVTEDPIVQPKSIETATPTEIPATPTPEVTNYGVCETESFRECPIPAEDLFNGKYLAFLETLSTPFDPEKMKQVPWFNAGAWISPNFITAPNFEGMTTIGQESNADFRRGVTSGYVEFEDKKYLLLPVEFYDQENPEKNVWIIEVRPLFHIDGNVPESAYETLTHWWRDLMKVTPLFTSWNPSPGVFEAPLVERTFVEDPAMDERFADFVAGKRSALHGKVLLTTITTDDGDKPVKDFN